MLRLVRAEEVPIDMSRAILADFPPEVLARVVAEASPMIAAHLADPRRHPAGLPELRTAVAERYTHRGLPTTPEQILITGGSRAGLALAAGLFCGPDDRVVVENPTHPEALAVLRSSTLRLIPLPVGADAAVLTALVPRLAYLSAGYQTPTGTVMSAESRLAVADAARRAGTWLVADESAIDLALDGDAPDPFAHGIPRAATDQIIAIGSLTETHGVGLQVGWIRASGSTAAALARRQEASGVGVSVLDQIIAVDLLRRYDAVLAERCSVLRERRAVLEAALARHLPQWTWRTPAGGLALWVDLGRRSATAFARRAAAEVLIAEGSRFGVDHGAFDQRVQLPYTLPPAILAEAVRRLASVWQ